MGILGGMTAGVAAKYAWGTGKKHSAEERSKNDRATRPAQWEGAIDRRTCRRGGGKEKKRSLEPTASMAIFSR